MLAAYELQTQRLLQNPGAPQSLYAKSDIDSWVNTARGQIAGEGNAIRVFGTINTVVGQRVYNFSSINLGTPASTGIAGVIHVRSILYSLGTGQQAITRQGWEWFNWYYQNNPVPMPGPPQNWSQFAQGASGQGTGSAASGSFYLDNPPDLVYRLSCDCVCYPTNLVDDTTVEALPYLWSDCVPFFAAWYALLSSQTGARTADAEKMFKNYQMFLDRARQLSNPDPERWLYQQSGDPTQANKLGMQQPRAAGGGG